MSDIDNSKQQIDNTISTLKDEISNLNNKLSHLSSLEITNAELIAHNSHLENEIKSVKSCLLYTSPSPRDLSTSRMPSSA